MRPLRLAHFFILKGIFVMKKILAVVLVIVIWVVSVSIGTFYVSADSSTVSYKTGDIVEFGSYPQSAIKDGNGATIGFNNEPIKWRILKTENGKALLLSSLIIDAHMYNHTSATVNGYYGNNYAHSDVRNYLINDFYNTAFSNIEKNSIVATKLDNSAAATSVGASGSYTKYSSESTTDKIFLLSKSEAETLAKNYYATTATDYAYYNGFNIDTSNGYKSNSWSLRTAGNNTFQIYVVQIKWGQYTTYFNWDDSFLRVPFGIRPAIWVDLQNFNNLRTGVFQNYVISVVYGNESFVSDVTVGGKKYELAPNYRISISQAESYKGKNVVITLNGGKVVNIETDGNYESQVSNWNDLSTAKTAYNATSYSKTADAEVKAALENYLQKMKDYFKALNTETGTYSVDINNLIKELKQGKKALFNLYNENDVGGDIPYKVNEAAYYGIANFIKDYADENQLTLNIDPDKEDVLQAFSSLNQLLKNTQTPCKTYEYDGYKITVKNAILVSNAFTGNVAVEKYNGKNCIESYSGQIVSDEETAKKAISSYADSLSGIVEKECKYAVYSLYTEFSTLTKLNEVSEDYLKGIISNDVNKLLKKHKLGDVLKAVIAIQRGYKVVKDCTTLKNIDDFEKLYRDTKAVSFDIDVNGEILKKAVSSIKEAKKDLVNALYNYLYHTNTGDPDYWTFQQKFANPKVYLKSLIQCPVEFEIYDENDNLIGYVDSSDNHEEYIWFDESIFISVDGDVKTIYIPKDMKTTINFKPTSNGFLNYSLAEIQNGQETGKLEYFNVPLNVGNNFAQIIPENADISVNSSGFELLGDEINECGVYYSANDNASIKVEAETSLHGQIAGVGEYPVGELVELYAFPDDGYKFLGWYVDDVCVSKDCVYKFTGMEDIKLVALFGNSDIKNFIISDISGDGKVDAQDLTVVVNALLTDTEYNEVFDINGDGIVNILDLVKLKKYLADNIFCLADE